MFSRILSYLASLPQHANTQSPCSIRFEFHLRIQTKHCPKIQALIAEEPRWIAIIYTDDRAYFVSESPIYRLLKAQDLITSPAYFLTQASDAFEHPSQRVNELWQTDFTYFKIIGWGWYYLLTNGITFMLPKRSLITT